MFDSVAKIGKGLPKRGKIAKAKVRRWGLKGGEDLGDPWGKKRCMFTRVLWKNLGVAPFSSHRREKPRQVLWKKGAAQTAA